MSSGSNEQHGQQYRLTGVKSAGETVFGAGTPGCVGEPQGRQDRESEMALTRKSSSSFLRPVPETWRTLVNNQGSVHLLESPG